MRARAIRDLSQLTDSEFFETVSEGLQLIISNAGRLCDGAEALTQARQFHASRVLAAIAEEEASKFLILLDAVRCPRLPGDRFAAQLGRFNDHLAKGLYARACGMRPTTLRQLQDHVDHYRQEFYLDGPNDGDWVFRNEVIQDREGMLYVDYISTDEGHSWTDPGHLEDFSQFGQVEPRSLKMARALFDVGISTKDAIATVAEVWRPAPIRPDMTSSELSFLNRDTLGALQARGLPREQSEAAYAWIVDEWQFPMYDLDLTLVKVEMESLRERQSSQGG